jgi:hypothetical protein
MNYIANFSHDPNSLTDEQLIELKNVISDAVKNKVSNLEHKYDIKMKFPPNTCNLGEEYGQSQTTKNFKPLLPTFITPSALLIPPPPPSLTNIAGEMNLSIYVPFDALVQDTSNENNIDNLSSCMKIVNSVKADFKLYNEGKKTKEEIDSTFFDWVDADKAIDTVYEHEIDELYASKFGNKKLIKKLIEELESENYSML